MQNFVFFLMLYTSASGDIRIGGALTGTIVFSQFSLPQSYSIIALADQLSQEGNEQFEISLRITDSESLSEPVFVLGPAIVTVTDQNGEKQLYWHYYLHQILYCII